MNHISNSISPPILTRNMTDKEYQIRLNYLRKNNNSKQKLLPARFDRRCKKTVPTAKTPHALLIKDVLRSIRGNHSDYLFNEDQILELLYYEPWAKVRYIKDFIWEISLPTKKMR